MDENKPKNIFDAAASKSKKAVPPKGKTPAPPPKKIETPQPEVSIQPESLLDLHKDPEINGMLNKMYRMQENIQTKLNEAYDKSGISASQIKNFLNNPSNFSPDIWQKIQGQRDVLEKQIGDVLKNYARKTKKGYAPGSTVNSKERKSKTLGARRNWIPM
jgi:hypothetical protein